MTTRVPCPDCNYANDPRAPLCDLCGALLQGPAREAPPAPAERPSAAAPPTSAPAVAVQSAPEANSSAAPVPAADSASATEPDPPAASPPEALPAAASPPAERTASDEERLAHARRLVAARRDRFTGLIVRGGLFFLGLTGALFVLSFFSAVFSQEVSTYLGSAATAIVYAGGLAGAYRVYMGWILARGVVVPVRFEGEEDTWRAVQPMAKEFLGLLGNALRWFMPTRSVSFRYPAGERELTLTQFLAADEHPARDPEGNLQALIVPRWPRASVCLLTRDGQPPEPPQAQA